jgi:hypothetical protein
MAASHADATISEEQDQMQRNPIRDTGGRFRRATLAGVLLAGTALGGFAAGHTTLAATTAAQPVNPRSRSARSYPASSTW